MPAWCGVGTIAMRIANVAWNKKPQRAGELMKPRRRLAAAHQLDEQTLLQFRRCRSQGGLLEMPRQFFITDRPRIPWLDRRLLLKTGGRRNFLLIRQDRPNHMP